MHRSALLAAVAALAFPAVALATPPHPQHPSHPATPAQQHGRKPSLGGSRSRTVLYVLRGTLSGYVAASGSTNGSVTIAVTSSNTPAKTWRGSLTFVVTSSTRVVLDAKTTAADGDKGIVKLRLAKDTAYSSGLTATQLIDQS